METFIALISDFSGMISNIDWGAFFIWWLGIERVLRAVSKITPWQWDDDLVNWISSVIPKRKPPTA